MHHDDIRPGDQIGAFRVVGMLPGGGYRAVGDDGKRVHLDIKPRHGLWRDATMEVIGTARVHEALHHPGIARLVDRGVLADHRPWFALEVPSGIALGDLIARRTLPPPEVASLVRDLAHVLSYAHERGIAHGALSLRSVVFATGARDFALCVTDWGFTPDELGVYAAPEATVHPPGDLFALGVIAYRAATQAFPPPAVHDVPRLPAALAELIVRMLSPEVFDRPTAGEVCEIAAELVTAGDDRVHVTGPRFGKPKWTPAPPITSESTPVVAGEIPDHERRKS